MIRAYLHTREELLEELADNKAKLIVEGDRIKFTYPKDGLTPEFLSTMKRYKPWLLSWLPDRARAVFFRDKDGNLSFLVTL